MTWQEYFTQDNKTSTSECPSKVGSDFMLAEADGCTVGEFLKRFEFASKDELQQAVRDLCYCIAGDKFISNKKSQEDNIHCAAIYRRMFDVIRSADKIDKYPYTMAASLWSGYYARHNLKKRLDIFFKKKSKLTFEQSCNALKQVYSLTDNDIEKLHFFVEMVKAGDDFPCSLRRMLYVWGKAKMTGKTTIARMLTAILNGSTDWLNSQQWSSDLAYEMQIRAYAVPKITECSVVMMDECFFADMGKMYADFKRFITSQNGRARLPYGQEFQWFGNPNYIATSNEPLQTFIKDWNDRRYLSIELKKKPIELQFNEIFNLLANFVLSSTRTKEWKEWADALAQVANVDGERQEFANEFENELLHNEFADEILNRDYNATSRVANCNRYTLKFFVDYFSRYNNDARKRRGEIEVAVRNVFGEPETYGGTKFWLIDKLRDKALTIKANNNK